MSIVASNYADESEFTDDGNDKENKNENLENHNTKDSIVVGEQTDFSSSIHVNTNDCVLPVANAPLSNNKYKMNMNFDQNLRVINKKESPNNNNKEIENQDDNDSNVKDNDSWLPSILKYESWPDENSAFISDIANGVISVEDDPFIRQDNNPMLSVRDTVLWKNDTEARESADWKKYKEDTFMKLINNNKLKNLPDNQSPVPNTFANKFNKIHKVNNPASDSPLKLFGAHQDTYTKFKINNMLAQLSPKKKTNDSNDSNVGKLPNVIKQSDELYNKILTNSSSNGSLLQKVAEINFDDEQHDDINDQDQNDDITSDAEEFSSFPSTTRKIVHDGNKLFQNIRKNFQNERLALPSLMTPYTQSDYTSAEEEERLDGSSTPEDPSIHEEQKIYQIRNRLSSRAEAFNSEFNISPPKLQLKYRVGEENTKDNDNKPKKLNFIPADQYKDKVFDKKLKKFVSKSQLANGSTFTDSSFTDNLETQDDATLENLSKTNNSILITSNNKTDKNNIFQNEAIVNEHDNFEQESEISDDSFTITDKLLVKVINETYPVEDWDMVEELDINGFELERLDHLNKMTPNIWYLNASNNEISQNFGIPSNVQFLNLSFNKFNEISAKFDHFHYLQVLNLSHNKLTDLRCLSKLKNLTNLDLSFNKIKNIEYLENFKMLHYLNLSNNQITGQINFRQYKLWFLEDLLLDNNELEYLINISELPRLINLSANNNNITKFIYNDEDENILSENVPLHDSLRRICLNDNKLFENINFSDYPELKEIQLDGNFMDKIDELSLYTEKISSRYNNNEVFNQNILKFSLQSNNLKTLYLTGGLFPRILPNFKDKFSSIKILDLSAMDLLELPGKFSEFFPLLIDLNLNFNKLKNLKGLENLQHLKQLKLLGNDISEIDDIIEHTSSMRMTLKFIDLRVNPITKKFYPFVFYTEENENDETSENFTAFNLHDKEDIEAFSIEYSRLYGPEEVQNWMIKNRKYQRKLSREGKGQRNGYIADMIVWFEHIRYLDGQVISDLDKKVILKSFA
jgi:Leucine-rich repeat (LRR) protein